MPQSLIDKREQYYISKFDSFLNGYNSTIGGVCKPKKERKVVKTKYIVDLFTGIIYNSVSDCARSIGESRGYVSEQLLQEFGSVAYCDENGGPIV